MHRQSLYRYNPISTNPRSLCTENPNRVATMQILPIPPNAQAAGELCVDKTQSAQICNLCVEKNPRPRRARTNSGRAQLLIGKTIIGRCFNNFLLANRPMIVFPIRKTPVQILAKKNGIRVTKLTPADFCAERDPARPRLPQHYPAGDS